MIRVFASNFGAGGIFEANTAWPISAVNTVEAQRQVIRDLKAALNAYRVAAGLPAIQ